MNDAPGRYAYEIVGDMPVHAGGTCCIGRSVDGCGDDGKDGLVALMPMCLPRNDPGRAQTFSVNGVRTVASVATSIEKKTVNGGNGCGRSRLRFRRFDLNVTGASPDSRQRFAIATS
ncbi:hypothetical protein [Burkholderia pyrrocinia]|uniref:hypothetical protein n=1 Tax=Burkholderia pyrrocinia TaxID=60550 RepID=UPI002AB0272A|nr:hypothetical protein [Burkholderia pyrrocinia]